MSNSKLGQTLVKIIEDGNSDKSKKKDESELTFEDIKLPEDDKEKEENKKNPFHSVDSVDPPKKVRKEKLKSNRPKTNGKMFGVISIFVSVSAVAIASFTAISLQVEKNEAINTQAKIDEDFGRLNKSTTELLTDVSSTKKSVISNTEKLSKIGELNNDIQHLKSDVGEIKQQLGTLTKRLDSNDKSIVVQRKQVREMKEQLGKIMNRPVKIRSTPVKSKKTRTSARRTNNYSYYSLEGATIASIDSWGGQPHVVLREQNGNWVPLTKRDHYKGWKLVRISENQAEFQKNKKTKKLSIKE